MVRDCLPEDLTVSNSLIAGILDLLAKPVFGALLIWGHRNIDPARLGLNIRDYTGDDTNVHEKRNGRTNGTNGATHDRTNGARPAVASQNV